MNLQRNINIVVARGGVGLFCIECDEYLMRIKAGDSIDMTDLLSDIEQLRHECEPGVLVTAP